MCGIVLMLVGKPTPKTQKAFQRACRAVRPRGPDFSGLWQSNDGHVLLGHERLAVVRPASGEQPLLAAGAAEPLVLVVNGEIYNFVALASELGVDAAALRTDCDVILELAKRGQLEQRLAALRGVFAICLYDAAAQRIVLARDRLGIAPLYIGYGHDVFVAASELKGVLAHPDVRRVEQVPPGHFVTLDLAKGVPALCGQLMRERRVGPNGLHHTLMAYERWWALPEPLADAQSTTFKQAVTLVHDRLVDAVIARLEVCDVPFGSLLSGGLDSSIVAAVAARHLRSASSHVAWQAPERRLHTFAVGLDGAPDLPAARVAAAHIDALHHEHIFTIERGLHALRDVIEALETYDVTTIRSSVPMSLLTRLVKAHGIKCLLSGEGADELFGGYMYFHMAPNAAELEAETRLKVDQLYHYDVLRANKICAMNGVEVRVPFLDHEFVETVFRDIPAEYKMPRARRDGDKSRIEKMLLRAAFESYLPDEIAWRQKEQFSDGCGTGWIEQLKVYAEQEVDDVSFDERHTRFPVQTPTTKEAYYYRSLFEEIFAGSPVSSGQPSSVAVFTQPSVACSTETALKWCGEQQGNQLDPSGRAVLSKWK